MTQKLRATVENADDASIVTLAGFLDEDNNLKALVEQIPAGPVMIDLAGIARINSVGIRDWVNWLAALEANGTRAVLVGCSPPIVAQINLVKNFAGNGAVKSFQIPYHCSECDEEKIETVETAEMMSSSPPACLCPHCKRAMEVDEMPESYFAFLALPAAPAEPAVRESGPDVERVARGSSAGVKSRVKTRERRSDPPARISQPVLSAYQTPTAGTKRISSTELIVRRPSRPSQARIAAGSADRISGSRISGSRLDPRRDSTMPPRNDTLLWIAIVLVLVLGIGALGYFVLVQ
jgi:anti-anti-sigma regulatory factor